MRAFRAATMTELHDKLCDKLIHARHDELDMVTSVDVQFHDTMSRAESMAWEFDLKSMWLTPSRWSMMVKQYLDPEDLDAWLRRSVEIIGLRGRGINVLRTRLVRPRGGADVGNKETRRWGSCMLALSYKALPQPQITLHSRTSYLGYIGALDLTVAWVAARYLARALNIPVESLAFVWYNEALQWHNFKSLAYMLNHHDPLQRKRYRRLMLLSEKKLEKGELKHLGSAPALTMSRKWMQKLVTEDRTGVMLGDMSYNTYRRIRRRYHTEVRGYEYAKGFESWSVYKTGPKAGEQKEYFKAYQPLPSTPASRLDFRAIGIPFDRDLGIAYDGTDDAEVDEDED